MSEQNDTTEVDLKGPGGIGAAIKSSSTIVLAVMLFLVVAGAFGFGIARHEEMSQQRANETTAAIKAMSEATAKLAATQRETSEAMIWVLSKPQAEREKLDLSKPRFVSDMQR